MKMRSSWFIVLMTRASQRNQAQAPIEILLASSPGYRLGPLRLG